MRRKQALIPFLIVCCATLASCTREATLDRFRYYRSRHDLYNDYYSPVYNPTKVLLYADSMAWLLRKNELTTKFPAEYAMACNLQGQGYTELKRYPEAIMAFSLCRLLAEKAGDSCLVAKYNSTMGTIRFRQAQYPESVELYKRSLAEETACKADGLEYHDRQGNLDNIALAYTRYGQYDSAMVYYQKATDYLTAKRYLYTTDSVFPEIALGVVYGNEALAVEATGDDSTAELLLKKSIAINSLPGRDNSSGTIEQLHLAELYLRTKRNAEAYALLRQTANRLPPGDDGTRKLWLGLMWKYNEAIGNDREAKNFLKATLQLTDSMALIDRYRYTTNEDNVYQLFEDKNTIQLLQKSNTIQQMSLIIGAMLFFMAVTFTILVRRNLKRNKRTLTELTAKNEAILRQQEQLEHLLAAVDRKNSEKDRILQVVAHDLRSPIGGIKMMSDMILGRDERHQAEMLGFIRNGASNCLDLVNELLQESFSGLGMVLDKSVLDLRKLVAECAQLMQFTAAEKDQEISTVLPAEKQPILADAGKLSRVVNNLLSNAIKFSKERGAIVLSLSRNGQYHRITVRDYGIGIPIADQHQVFDTFTLSRRPGTNGERSFGFGLSISKQIIEAHGGKIGFSSHEDQGSEFYLDLPLAT